MCSDENRMEFFYYEDCECGIAITHNQTIISANLYEDEKNVKSAVLLYLFDFVRLKDVDLWID
jgi:hypothetical protein